MIERRKDIVIKISLDSKEYQLRTYEGEYPNLMMLLADQLYLEDFGECKGIGRCGTCHVYILNPSTNWLLKERNENTTLNKLWEHKDNSRLACQMLIDNSMDGLHVHVKI